MPLTPQQAADRAGCARSSIMRALASSNLKAGRDNHGRWHIDPAVLDDWLSMRPPVRHSPLIGVDTATDRPETGLGTALDTLRNERDEARLEAAALRAETAQLRDRLGEVQAERDRWRVMAERLAEREAERPPNPSVEPRPRPGFLARLLGLDRTRSA